ncbi:5-phosphohydroxy-L-lysine phospho-lyase-like isoform X1 [Penaeus chinensis]|uniref:5-phosphohydroxy-L-lysine phospho-lyase-like isoform X1 n=1 Tax=Penaeus chinensis TaxID=139456 RepID=UPI001FB58DB0|nr:5-phosphohydroxy-L-lysine phospho-lyase-like isoform X1 [Penaeus chinensis]
MDGRNPCGSGGTLHFETAPLKIVRAEKQFMTDNFGIQYLDCVSNVAHVGHCHPHVVAAGKNQMATLVSAQGFMNDALTKYVKQLVNKLPDILSICYLVNSGSEANDLALRLARAYTNRKDVVVFDDAYHGNLGNLIDISPKMFKQMPLGKKEFVHVIPCPDTYRGLYREDDLRAAEKYVKEAEHIIHQAIRSNRKIACFVSESIVVNCGVIVPPRNYFRLLYNLIHEIGGVCIADEVQTGLGRTGEYFWAFESITNWWQGGLCVLLACNKDIQSPKSTRPLLHNRPCLQNHHYGVTPDIVCIGKPLGNGHPMGAVITTREIADSLGEYYSTFGGNPVACAIGMAVLDVIENEKLVQSAKAVGKTLLENLQQLRLNHRVIGDVRGIGLCIGVEVVEHKTSRKPATALAQTIIYKLKEEHHILVQVQGPGRNVICITPPMCFTQTNARSLFNALDAVLTSLAHSNAEGVIDIASNIVVPHPRSVLSMEDLENMSEELEGPEAKKARTSYDDID